MNADTLQTAGLFLVGAMIASFILGLIFLVVVIRVFKQIDVPAGADFTETLRHTPLLVVVTIDLLDFGLDILAAPFSWVILDRLGLKALRGVAAVEAFIPFTQFIPTMTLCWFGARFFGRVPGTDSEQKYIIDQYD